MATLMEELCEALEDHSGCIERLRALASEKKEAVIKNDIEALRGILARENESVGRAQRMEKRRDALFTDIAAVLNRPKDGLTLDGLCEAVEGQPEYLRLKTVAARLKEAMGVLKAANSENKVLIENALDYVEFSVNVLRTTFVDESRDYVETGKGVDIKN